MNVNTHLGINHKLCGQPVETGEGGSRVRLLTSAEMAADEQGLVHGGFVFGMADYAAMLAVNHPYVVLGGASSTFHKPVKVGQMLEARAVIVDKSGRRNMVNVEVFAGEVMVFSGEFACFVLDGHVLG